MTAGGWSEAAEVLGGRFRHPDTVGAEGADGLVGGYATPPERLYGAALQALGTAPREVLGD
ncbi:hypothetical protein [Streptomyces sp. NPDC053755]|uniref:hypothetical protein n=1 Tax=Streptomyces sp. NPDC053755 TaxID=3155815 RepID=UPI003445C3EF